MPQPLVAVTTDVKLFENYTWHAAPQQYLEAAITAAGVLPALVPSFGERLDPDALLDRVDGVLLTGSRSNVHPSLYGAEATEANGPYDRARDDTAMPLIRKAIERGVPLLAICRGLQELNVALGGTLATEIQERPGAIDHRAPQSDRQDDRFAIPSPSARAVAWHACWAPVAPTSTPSIARQSTGRAAGCRSRPSRGMVRSRRFRSRMRQLSRSACSGTPNTGYIRTRRPRRSSGPSAMPRATTRQAGPAANTSLSYRLPGDIALTRRHASGHWIDRTPACYGSGGLSAGCSLDRQRMAFGSLRSQNR